MRSQRSGSRTTRETRSRALLTRGLSVTTIIGLVVAGQLAMPVSAANAAQIDFPVLENFDFGTSGQTFASNTSWTAFGSPKLTGTNAAQSGAAGKGWLQLTSNAKNQSSGIISKNTISTAEGASVQFDFRAYSTGTVGPGDGFSFFLQNADNPSFTPARLGAAGSGLSYSSSCTGDGLQNGYLGVGFDAYGNFSTSAVTGGGERNEGVARAASPNSVVIRGSGDGGMGSGATCGQQYLYATGKKLTATEGTTLTQTGVSTSAAMYRRATVSVTPQPGHRPLLSVSISALTTVGQEPSSLFKDFLTYQIPDTSTIFDIIPSNLRFGFAASTGGATQYTEIDNIRASTSADASIGVSATPTGATGPTVSLPLLQPGKTDVGFTFSASNAGPGRIRTDGTTEFARISSDLSSIFTNVRWTCTPSGGAVCGTSTGSGTGKLLQEWGGPPGSSVRLEVKADVPINRLPGNYTATAVIPTDLTKNLLSSTSALITPDEGVSDPNLTNNTLSILTTVASLVTSDTSQLAITGANRVANGSDYYTATATVKNTAGQVVVGSSVTFSPAAGMVANPATVPTDNLGIATTKLTSTGAKTYALSATVAGIAIGGTPANLTFVPGSVPTSGANSPTLTLSSAGAVANGVAGETATVTLTDANGNPVTGKAASLAISANPAPGVTFTGFTEATPGVYTATLKSQIAGAKQITVNYDSTGANINIGPQTVTFVPGPAVVGPGLSTVSISANSQPANNTAEHVLTVTLRDAGGNAISGLASSLAGSAPTGTRVSSFIQVTPGVYEARVASTVAGDKSVAVTLQQGENALAVGSVTAAFIAGPASAMNSIFTVSEGNKVAGVQQHSATVTVRDAFGNIVVDQNVVFSSGAQVEGEATVASGPSGTASVQISSTSAGTFAVAATIQGNQVGGTAKSVAFVAGAPSLSDGKTVLRVSAGDVEANGAASHDVTVSVRDALGNPVPGARVVFSIDPAVTVVNDGALEVTTLASGDATVQLASSASGTYPVSASVDGTALGSANGAPATLSFRAGAPDATKSSWTASPSASVVANGTDSFEATVTMRDAQGNPVPGAAATFSVPDSVQIVEDGPYLTTVDGTITVHLVSLVSGEAAVSAAIGSDRVGEERMIKFVAGPPNFDEGGVSLSVSTGDRVASGGDAHEAKVVVLDANENPVKDATVAFSVDSPASLGSSTATTDATGTATVAVYSETAGTFQVSATVNGTSVTGGNQRSATFVAGPASEEASTFRVLSRETAIANGGDNYTLEAKVLDAHNNPVAGVTVAFDYPAAVVGDATATTGADGVATAELATIKAGDYEVSARIGPTQIGDAKTLTYVAGEPDISGGGSELSYTSGTRVANGADSHRVTALVRDASLNPVKGAEVTFTVAAPGTALTPLTATTTSDGTVAVDVASETAGSILVTASVGGKQIVSGGPAEIVFVAGQLSIANSRFEITPSGPIRANDVAQFSAVVTARDRFNNPISGLAAAFTFDQAINGSPTVETLPSGQAVSLLTSTRAGKYPVSASINNQPVGDPIDITFEAGPVAVNESTFSVTPGNVEANGTARHTATVTVRDAYDNPVTGAEVIFTVDPSATGGATVRSGDNGEATTNITSTTSGNYGVSAQINGVAVGRENVSFISGAASAAASSWSITPEGTVTANGSDHYQATVNVTDEKGNAVAGAELSFANPGEAGILESGPYITGQDGTLKITIASTKALKSSFQPLLGGDTIGSASTLIFEAGEAFANASDLIASPVIAESNGSQKVIVTVILRDVFGNQLSAGGADVKILSTRGAVSDITDRGDGTYEAAVTSLTEGPATLTFSVGSRPGGEQQTVNFLRGPTNPTADPSRGSRITGTGDPGSTIQVTNAAGDVIALTKVGPDGTYSIVPSPTPGDGEKLSILAIDINGFQSGKTDLTIDATSPSAPSVAPSNGSVIFGTAEPGSTITITDASGNVIATLTTAEDGRFEFAPSAPDEDGAKFSITSTDAAGNVSPAAPLTIDGSAVNPPTLSPTNGTGFEGTGTPGNTVIVTLPGGEKVEVPVDDSGTWKVGPFAPDQFKNGDTVSVAQRNPAGTVSPASEQEIDTVAPASATLNPSNGKTISGGSISPDDIIVVTDEAGTPIAGTTTIDEKGDFIFTPDSPITNGTIVNVNILDPAGNKSGATPATIDATPPAPAIPNMSNGKSISGRGVEKGSTVTLLDSQGNTIPSTVQVNDDGTFSITPVEPLQGDAEYSLVISDRAGNTSESTPVIVDTTPPSPPTLRPSNGTTIEGGPLQQGETVRVVDENGDAIPGNIVLNEDGTFVFTPTKPLAEGSQAKVIVTDRVGNQVTEEASIDTAKPDSPSINPSDGSSMSGCAEPGSTVTIRNDVGEILATTTAAEDCSYSVAFQPELQRGSTVTVTTTDPSGNESKAMSLRLGLARAEVQETRLPRGETQIATGIGFQPGETVHAIVHSDPVEVGVQTADSQGGVRFVFAIPTDLQTGNHSVEISGERSGSTQAQFEVVEAATSGSGSSGGSAGDADSSNGNGGLVVTGSDPGIILPLAALLAAAGVLLAVAALRRRSLHGTRSQRDQGSQHRNTKK